MQRRDFITLLGGATALWPFAPYAQQSAKLYRIGILSPERPPPGFLDAFRQGLRELGYVEGRDIALEVRNAEGYSNPKFGGHTFIGCHLPVQAICRGWGTFGLRTKRLGNVSPSGLLCGSHPEGRPRGRSARGRGSQIRSGRKLENRKDARCDDPTIAPCSRR